MQRIIILEKPLNKMQNNSKYLQTRQISTQCISEKIYTSICKGVFYRDDRRDLISTAVLPSLCSLTGASYDVSTKPGESLW